MRAEIGIIGGTGLYDPELLKDVKKIKVSTPYGSTSDLIILGELEGREVAFINRHGQEHTIPPHKVNYRANIWALKELGVKRILAPSAVGSLKEEFKPGDIMIIDQFIDFTKKREYTFYEGGKVFHVSLADPFCPELRSVLIEAGKELKLKIHEKGTYICIEGPRFSTRAESMFYRNFADVIGMTLVPEVNLAREAEICYSCIAMISDFDVWAEVPVSVEEILRIMKENIEKVKNLLQKAIVEIPIERECKCKEALKDAGV